MAATTKWGLGMGHQSHPWLGHLVADTAHSGRVGVLQAVAPDVDDIRLEPIFRAPDEPPVAWLRPKDGGMEWTTALVAIQEVPGGMPVASAPDGTAGGSGGVHRV
ncbi:hypothetical protein [Streptomyces phytophilus]|uniref:hypothetical protein n=1 Tax=Streptomyces phytophilus TaxID=722715 RepID=UPI0015F03B93|nr:hypothetical protein [Streptomyces phytophilus]